MNSPIQAVIFDCFGVLLLDTRRALKQQFPEQATQLHDLNLRADYGQLEQEEYVAAVAELIGWSSQRVLDFIHVEHSLNQPLLDYIRRQLKPHYRIGMLSNVGRGWLDDFFQQSLLDDAFDVVVTSGEEGIVKPHPHIFEIMAERIGVAPEACVMIDDLPENCAGADAAGMQTIPFTTTNATISTLTNIFKKQ